MVIFWGEVSFSRIKFLSKLTKDIIVIAAHSRHASVHIYAHTHQCVCVCLGSSALISLLILLFLLLFGVCLLIIIVKTRDTLDKNFGNSKMDHSSGGLL
jgi:hypothetical protein